MQVPLNKGGRGGGGAGLDEDGVRVGQCGKEGKLGGEMEGEEDKL